MLQVTIALWLRSSSAWPEVLVDRDVDPCWTVHEAVCALMQEYRETYVYKAAVQTPYGTERLWRLQLALEVPECQISALEVVKALWPLLEADGIDPVTIRSLDALDLVRVCAADDPASLFALWSRSALAVDDRLFSDFWNNRRASAARSRLWSQMEKEVPDGSLV